MTRYGARRWDGMGGELGERKSRASPPEAVGLLRVPRRAAEASRPCRAAIPDAGFTVGRVPVAVTQSPP